MGEGESVRLLGELIDEVVFVTDLTVGMLWANERLTDKTGFRAEDFAFLPKENPFIHPDDVTRVAEAIARFVASDARVSEPIENRFFTRWGEVVACRSTVLRIEWEGKPALLFVVRTTERPDVAPGAEEQSFRRIVEEAHEGIVKVSSDGRVHYANGRFRQLVGKGPVDLAKCSFFDLVVAEARDAVRDALARIASAPETFETKLYGGGRAPLVVTVSGSKLVGRGDEDLMLLLVRDVTDERRVARALQEAQKLESIGVLVGGVAHDFNNIATSMRASVSVAERLAPPGGRLAEVLHDLDVAGRRAADITSSLLAYAGKTPAQTESVELVEIVRQGMRLLRAFVSSSIRLTVVEPQERLTVKGDARQLGQVLVNLVANAAEAIETDAGEVEIAVRAVDVTGGDGARWLPAPPPPGRYVALVVRDNGKGMSAEVLDHFADLFFTTKSRGHGLGLPATLGIVRLHGGALRVPRVEGKGSVVEALFPRIDAAPRPIATASKSEPSIGEVERGGTVLLVEDEPSLRKLGSWILEDAGFEIVSAADGTAGLALFEASPSRFRAVVVDDHMPGISGQTLLTRFREKRRNVPVVLMSGYLESPPKEECVFLHKPYDGEALVRAVFEALKRA